jgi:hypothetical protein
MSPLFRNLSIQTSLSETERQDLLYLFEEHKMLIDLYSAISVTHPTLQVISNVGQADDQLLKVDDALTSRLGFASQTSHEQGFYNDKRIKTQYDLFAGKAGGTAKEVIASALQVEEQHLALLTSMVARTSNTDLLLIYQMEQAVARNNIRALFVALGSYGQSTYTPRYLTVEAYKEIVNAKMEEVPGVF